MRHIALIIGLLSGVYAGILDGYAQGLKFSDEIWDFGEIKEDGGEVTHSFSFKNESSKPIVIHNVRTTCGCTTPEFESRPLAVGAESSLSVTFDPRYRPGRFKKDIYVYSTLSKEPLVLTITGRVLPRVLSVEERYPYKLSSGGRLGQMYVTVAQITPGEMMQTSVEYYNGSSQPIEVEFKARTHSERLRLFYDGGLAANSGATLEIGYFVEAGEGVEREPLRDTLDIYVNGENSGKSIFVRGMWRE